MDQGGPPDTILLIELVLIGAFFQRAKLHRMMGIRFDSHAHKRATSGDEPKSESASPDVRQEFDVEAQNHKKVTSLDGDPEEKTETERTDAEDTNSAARSDDQTTSFQKHRLSKPPSLKYTRPEDLIVVPGQESEPEDSIHARKGKEAQKNAASLSRRSSVGSARSRLSKAPSVRARRSASLDRYSPAAEDYRGDHTPKGRPSEGRPASIISARSRDHSVNHFSHVSDVGRVQEVGDDAAPQYI